MAWESFVGKRYLMAKRRSSVLSIITVISITGVALGVTALIVVLSVMGGFKKDLMEKILGTKAHIVVRAADFEPMEEPDAVAERVRQHPGVTGASPYVEAEVMVSSPTNLSGVVLRGINPEHIGHVSTLTQDMREGKLSYLRDAGPLHEELQSERARELDELLDRLESERTELDDLRNDFTVAESVKPFVLENDPEQNAPAAGDSPEVDDEMGMPPLPHEVLGEASEQPDEEGMMPALPHEAEGGQSAEEGEMPPLPGSEGGEEELEDIPGLIIGPELAKSLQVSLGDEVNVVTPNADMGPMGPIPRSRPFRIVGIFYSGMYEYDANFAYTAIEDANAFLNHEGATGIELKTRSVDHAQQVAVELQDLLGPTIEVLDWQELNRSLFYALRLEKIAMFVVLTFIILVASFSIVAMLIMIVIEKGREIAILKSMGASDGGVMRTFVYQGLVIGVFGALIGLGLGLVICYFLETVGFPLNSEVYYINTLPVDVDPVEVTLVVVCTIAISLLATVYPSIQAARLNPVDGLRYD